MNVFSQLLSAFVTKKNANISQMASFCGIDRSSMYKIVHGTRKPISEEMAADLARFLRLSPEEADQLADAYQIMMVGEENYRRRKDVRDFLRACFSKLSAAPGAYPRLRQAHSPLTLSGAGQDAGSLVLRGKGIILQTCCFILKEESRLDRGLVRIRMQPADLLTDMFEIFAASMDPEDLPAGDFTIRHIIAVDGGNLVEDNSAFNLNLLGPLVPVYRRVQNYRLYSYHTNLHAGETPFSFLPYLLVSRRYALEISGELDFAVLHMQPEAVHFFTEIFDRLLHACALLTADVRDYRDLLYNGKKRASQGGPLLLQAFLCVSFFLTEDLLEKYVCADVPERKFIIHAALEIAKRDRAYLETMPSSLLMSEKGFRDFMETGLLPEYPAQLYTPLSRADRLAVLRGYIEIAKRPNVFFRLLKDTFIDVNPLSTLWLDDSCASFMLECTGYPLSGSPRRMGASMARRYLFLRDPEILYALRDFFDHLDERSCFSEDQSLQILESILREAERGGKCL